MLIPVKDISISFRYKGIYLYNNNKNNNIMTDKEFIKFSKEYFGDLDYQSLSEAEYKDLYEKKEAERILSMINSGKLNGLFNNLTIKANGMTVSLLYNGNTISSTTLVYNNPETNI